MIYYSDKLLKKLPYCQYITDPAPMHGHKYWEIALLLKGTSYNHTLKRKKTPYPPGTVIILRPNIDLHYISHECGIINGHIDFYISDKNMKSLCDALKTTNGVPLYNTLLESKESPIVFLSQHITTYFNNLLSNQEYFTENPTMDNIQRLIISTILNEYIISLSKTVLEPSDMIKQVIEILANHNNFCERIEDLLKQIPYSRTYINREFKKYTKRTIINYFDYQKIVYASELLLQTDKTILDISNSIGFSGTKNFISQFKKVFACAPSEYRKLAITSHTK